MHGDPFGPVHHRRAGAVGRLPRAHADVGLRLKAVFLRQAVLAEGQLDPLSLSDRRRSGRHTAFLPSSSSWFAAWFCGSKRPVADELVDVLVLLVVAHVNDDAPVAGQRDGGVFVLEAAQRGVLARLRDRPRRIDLHDVAEPVGLVGMLGQIESFVVLPPAVDANRFVIGIGSDVAARGQAIAALIERRLESRADRFQTRRESSLRKSDTCPKA